MIPFEKMSGKNSVMGPGVPGGRAGASHALEKGHFTGARAFDQGIPRFASASNHTAAMIAAKELEIAA
jgi:hypothetical protein